MQSALRKISALMMFLLLALLGWAQQQTATKTLSITVNPASGTITAASCSATDVNAAVNASSNGGTVLVPGGTCTWDSGTNKVTISSSHQITLSGQSITTINWANSGTQQNPAFVVTAGTASNTRVTGFTFNGAYVNGTAPIQINSTFSPQTLAWRLDHSSLSYSTSGTAGTILIVNGNGPGLMDHTTWSTGTARGMEFIHLNGEGFGNSTAWAEDVLPGDSRNVFIEDSTFNFTAGGNTSVSFVESFYGARYVARHNVINMGVFDIHGEGLQTASCNNPPQYVNGRWFEAYSNAFHVTGPSPNSFAWFMIRGGSGIVFNNTGDNNQSIGQGSGAINVTSDCPITYSGGYPVPQQVGRGIGGTTHSSPYYFWNNINTVTSASMPFQNLQNQNANASPNPWVQQNRDWFTSASQPGTLTRCQSAADVSAGCPVSYVYTPFTYPHPLNH